jgi:DNA-binding HxlR family transcriptional regulator
MKRTSLEHAPCPVARSLDAIGDWWSLLIIRDALDGLRRFSEFQKSLGISKGILTARLKNLVALGILEALPVGNEGGHRQYLLTDKGRDLFLVVVSLRQWGEDHCFGRGDRGSVLVDRASGRPVARLALRSPDGRVLDQAMTRVIKAKEGIKRPKRASRRLK